MFATQNYVDVMPDPARKRGRDGEDETGNVSTGFGEHRNKRIQCLPLRTSPKSSQQWQAASITPLSSDSDEHIPQSHFSPWSSSPAVSSQPHGNAEMDIFVPMIPGGHHPTGRMPTPIQPSFAAQVRGQQGEWAGPGPVVSSLSGVVNMGHHHSGFADDQCVPRAMSGVSDWHAVQNNRRLPSPISEADDPTLMHGSGETIMAVDGDHNGCDDFENHSAVPSSPTRCMEHPNAMMDVETSPVQQEDGEGDASSPSPARRGHMRSKHTINNWTLQPGMKKSFSIGYRTDCEKCRLKVPGHFNHIIIS